MDTEKNSKAEESKNTSKEILFEIPADGSLGLLALGHVGIREWRKVRDAAKKSVKK